MHTHKHTTSGREARQDVLLLSNYFIAGLGIELCYIGGKLHCPK